MFGRFFPMSCGSSKIFKFPVLTDRKNSIQIPGPPKSLNQIPEIHWCFGGPPILLGGGFKYFLFSPLPGEIIQFD